MLICDNGTKRYGSYDDVMIDDDVANAMIIYCKTSKYIITQFMIIEICNALPLGS